MKRAVILFTAAGKRRILAAALLLGALASAVVIAQEAAPPATPPILADPTPAPLPDTAPAPTPVPHPGKTSVRFVGATAFNEQQLTAAIADQIAEMNQLGVTPATADDAAFFLGISYRNHGYSAVTVDSMVLGIHSVQLTVHQGPLTLLSGLQFVGVTGLPVASLRADIIGDTQARLPNKKTPIPFVQADIDTGVDRIKGLYQSSGFLDVVVDPAKVTFNSANTAASVVVTVHEGTQYHFGQISFQGDLVFYPNTELLKQLQPFTSKPYTPQQVINMQRAVVYFYKTKGYYDPKVDVQSDPKTASGGNVPVIFTVTTGPVYRFGGVSQEGLNRLSPTFLPDRFASLKGKFYNPELLDDKFRRMMETGLFKQLRVEPRPLPDDTLELHMVVEEEKARDLGVSLGYGTFEGPIVGFIAADRDLLGSGRPLTANVEISANIMHGEILYQDPWLFNSDYAFETRIYAQSEEWYRYNVFETGIRPQISRYLNKYLQAAVFLEGKEVTTTDEGITPSLLGPTKYFVGSGGASLTLDTRAPDRLNPRSGVIGSLIGEVASSSLESTVQFARATGRLTYYIPVTSKTLLALGARGGWMTPLSGNYLNIPLDERFFNGGSNSVRSFPERRLGPSDYHGYNIGGDTFMTYNAEYQFPLYQQIVGAAFIDAGSVGLTPGDMGPLRYGVGPGLRYASPVGPVRVDVGFNPDRRTGERRMMIHISFGMAF